MANNIPSTEDLVQDKDFLAAPSDQQRAYISSFDPDFAKAPKAQQDAYLSHIVQTGTRTRAPQPNPAPTPATGVAPASGYSNSQPSTMRAAPSPSWFERAEAAITGGIPYFQEKAGQMGRNQAPPMQLVTPEAALTPAEQQRHPIVTGAAQFAGGMTSPGNVAMIGATGGLGEMGVGGQVMGKLVSAYFTADMARNAYTQIPEIKKAADAGNTAEVERLLTIFGLTTATAGMSGAHTASPIVRPTAHDSTTTSPQASKVALPPQLDQRIQEVLAPPPQAGLHQPDQVFEHVANQATPASKVGEGTSAVHLASQPRTILPEQETQAQTGEIARGNRILQDPNATPEEKEYAQKIVESSTALRDQVLVQTGQRGSIGEPPEPTPILPEELAAISKMTPTQEGQSEAKIPIQVAQMREPPQAGPAPSERASTFEPPNPLDLVSELYNHFNRITSYSQDIAKGTNNADINTARWNRANAVKEATQTVRDLVHFTSPDALQGIREHLATSVDNNDKMADFINQAVAQESQTQADRKAMIEAKRVGYTTKDVSAPEGEEGEQGEFIDPRTGRPIEGAGRARTEAETKVVHRMLYNDLTGTEKRVSFDDFRPYASKTGYPEGTWEPFRDKALASAQSRYTDLLNKAQVLKDSGESLEDSDIPSELNDLQRDLNYLGFFKGMGSERGARPGVPIKNAETGEVRPITPFENITQAKAAEMMGKASVRNMPTAAEFTARANQLKEMSSLQKGLINAIDTKIGLRPAPLPKEGERGSVGEGALSTLPTKSAMVANAKAAGMDVWQTSPDKGPGARGWLMRDGTWFGIPSDVEHDTAAGYLMHGKDIYSKMTIGDGESSFLENGAIRKISPVEYHVKQLDPKTVDNIEMSTIHDGKHGQKLYVDEGINTVNSIELHPGWRDLGSALSKERPTVWDLDDRTDESGRVHGVEMMASMAGGMAVGFHFGGPVGSVVGGVLGATFPAVIRHPIIANSWRYMRGMRQSTNMPSFAWFRAPQDSTWGISPEMAQVREDQLQSLKAPERQQAYRLSLMGRFWKALDPFALVTDRPNPLQEWTMAQDPTGKGFRDAKGQLALNESTYLAARMGVSGMRGSVHWSRQMMNDIEEDARQADVHPFLANYLNLKAYDRAYQVVEEHMNDMVNETNQLKTKRNMSQDPVEQVTLDKHIDDNIEALKDMRDRYVSGKVAPKQYNPQKIQQDLQSLQQAVPPQKWGQVQALAQRVFDLNRQHLDMIADVKNNFKNSIIPQDLYNEFVARGNEYIPMTRIMDDMANLGSRWFGKSSPLYLRKQNVINQLEGSERTNVDPFQASADANAEATREFYRNQTLGRFINAANKSPEIAKYFTKVPADYKARKGEGVVGYYENGKQTTYQVPQAIKESLDISSPLQADTIWAGVNNTLNQVFKRAVTVGSPVWHLTRQYPNVLGRALVTQIGSLKPGDIASAAKDGFISAWTHDDKWQEALKTGLVRNGFMSMVYPESKISDINLGLKGPFKSALQSPIQTWGKLWDVLPEAVQLTAYNRLRQAGYDAEAAAFKIKTRGPIPDYEQVGRSDNAAAIAFTFLRADWAHIRSTLQLATDPEYRGRLAVGLAAMGMAGTALAIHNIQQTDDKGQPLWKQVTDSDKQRYHVILTGGTEADGTPKAIKVGKVDVYQNLFGPAEEAIYDHLLKIHGQNAGPRPLTQLMSNATANFIPGHPQFDATNMTTPQKTAQEIAWKTGASFWSMVSPAIRLPIEEGGNMTEQFGRTYPIVTHPEMSPKLQGYGEKNVSTTAMDIGQHTGISPQRIEHIARGEFGPLARWTEAGLDPLLRGDFVKTSGLPLTPRQGSSPITGPFSISKTDQQQVNMKNDFYSKVDQVSQPYNDYQKLKQANPQAGMAYLQMHSEEIAQGRLAGLLKQKMGELEGLQKQVDSMPDGPEKEQANRNLREVKMGVMNSFQSMAGEHTRKQSGSYGTGNALSQGLTGR